jgi:hypothetical protein
MSMKHITRDVLFMAFVSITTLSLLGMMYKSARVTRRQPVVAAPSIHLVPTDMQSMQDLDLCPLFVKPEEFTIDPELLEIMMTDFRAQEISKEDAEKQLAALRPAEGLKYHVFNEEAAEFEEHLAATNSPCVVSLGMSGEWDRSLIQYKSLDQFELAQKTSLSPALCAGHALNNARFIKQYAQSGEVKYLKYLHDLERSGNFLLDLTISDWVNVEVVKENIVKMGTKLDIDISNISAVSSVGLFDSGLESKPGFVLVNADEYGYVQDVKKHISNGLLQKNYVHVLIVGNEEFAHEHGHYFAFAIIKSENIIQYVVLDTMPNIYHLQEGSHEKNRLMYIINNIEQGDSSIYLANLREALLRQIGVL